MPTPAAESKPRLVMNENFMGRNILPIIAAALGLIGLVFLGVLVVPYMSDTVRIILMFVISVAIGGLGYILNAKNSTVLTRALIGTGVGGIFISILVTHLYFHAINDIVAFALLAVWIFASMWLAKNTNSLLIASLAHAGMVASIAMAYFGMVSNDRLVFVIVYQILATLTILIGNVVWVKKMYRFGLFASQAMILVSVIAMLIRLTERDGLSYTTALPEALILVAFLVQFLGATAIAYLLFVSCARVKDAGAMTILGVVNAVGWVIIMVTSIGVNLDTWTLMHLEPSYSIWHMYGLFAIPDIVIVTLVLLVAIAVTITGAKVTLQKGLTYGTTITMAVVATGTMWFHSIVMLYSLPNIPYLPWFVILAIVFLVLGIGFRSQVCTWIARITLALDAIYMLIFGYRELSGTWTFGASLGYLAVLVGCFILTLKQVRPHQWSEYGSYMVMGVFIATTLSLFSITYDVDRMLTVGIFTAVVAVMLAVIHFAIKAGKELFYRICELVFVIGTSFRLYEERWVPDTPSIVGIILSSLALVIFIVIALDRVRIAARAASIALRGGPPVNTTIELMSGFTITLAAVGILTPYDWFIPHENLVWGFPVSLVCMAVALVIVGLGLWSRVKSLRIYGLVVVIACVFKLVTIDIGSVDSIMRVVAFLGGAAICFGISALYNYTAKYFDKALSTEVQTEATVTVPPAPSGKTTQNQ